MSFDELTPAEARAWLDFQTDRDVFGIAAIKEELFLRIVEKLLHSPIFVDSTGVVLDTSPSARNYLKRCRCCGVFKAPAAFSIQGKWKTLATGERKRYTWRAAYCKPCRCQKARDKRRHRLLAR